MFKNKEGKVRSGWKIVAVLGVILFFIVVISTIVGIVASLFYISKMMSDGNLTKENLTQIFNTLADQNSKLSIVMMLVQELIFIIVPIFTWKVILKRSLSNMGLTPLKKNFKEFIIGLLFGILSMTIVFLLLIMTGSATVTTWAPHFALDQLIYIPIFISVGFAEEIFARGYVMSALRQTRNIYVAVIGSSVLFALLHSFNPGIGILPYINLMLFGILVAYIYLKSGNLWMCIGIHITWNYFQGYVFGFSVSGMESDGIITTQSTGNSLLTGGAFGPEGGLFVTIVLLLGYLFVKEYYKNSKFDFIASEPADIQKPREAENVLT